MLIMLPHISAQLPHALRTSNSDTCNHPYSYVPHAQQLIHRKTCLLKTLQLVEVSALNKTYCVKTWAIHHIAIYIMSHSAPNQWTPTSDFPKLVLHIPDYELCLHKKFMLLKLYVYKNCQILHNLTMFE